MAGMVIYSLIRLIVIPEHNIGLLYRNGKFSRRLEAGVYRLSKSGNRWTVKVYDTRRAILAIPGQELVTSDNVGLKVSVTVSYEIADPELLDRSVQNLTEALYSTVQLALRSAVGKRAIEEVLVARDEIGKEIFDQVVGELEAVGLKLFHTEIKDDMFPGELKRIFNEVVKARKEAQAMLEKARGETAALRHLANTAKIVRANPELLKLKELQVMSDTEGNTFVMGVSPVVPVQAGTVSPPREG